MNVLIMSLSEDLITPIIVLFIPNIRNIQEFKIGSFTIGNFIAAFINFIIIAFIIFLIVNYAAKIGLE